MNVLLDILKEVWVLTNEMSPYLLLGFLLAGVMHEFLPSTLYTNHLGKDNFRSVFLAALFGVPLPLCSCGVIPTAMGLRREGASKGATVSFLIATPQTGVDSIIATYSLMGLPFAIIRPIAAFLTAVTGGMLVNGLTSSPSFVKKEADTPMTSPHPTRTTGNYGVTTECGFCTTKGIESPLTTEFGAVRRVRSCLHYAFIEMMEDIGKWLVTGLVIAGIITAAVPDTWFTAFQGNTLFSILFVLLFSIPMYLCATGSIPIALALMMKGLTPGAALVLLMAGPASNVASILIINKVLGRKTLAVYLLSIIAGAIVFALGIDCLLPPEWFTAPLAYMQDCCAHQPGWFSILCTVLMIILLLHAICPHKLGGGHHHCHVALPHPLPTERKETSSLPLKEGTGVRFQIKGMNCHHCAANAQKAIAAVEGVEQVTVSLEDGQAYVTGHFREEDIREAVESIGFELAGV
ncbi:MAG: SO_0444 family Cu/Zn efflux transporter [Bacteroidaceae bacterium]|nr:SO_0444 family Cu/Zn efflux transporter [Bacteroidaceae bacterium]